jgi:hypothetical protein
MSLKDNITNPIIEVTNSMMAGSKISTEATMKIITHLGVAIDDAQMDIQRQLNDKINLWESLYGDEDKTLYTLGLRHAIDIINGELATDRNGFNDKPYVEGQEFKPDEIVENI